MQFRTQIPIQKSNHPIDYNSKIVSLGSCFAVNISEKFGYYKFRNSVNPFGILFHPLAIEKLVSFAVSDKEFTRDDIFHLNDCWHCFDAHSDLNSIEKDQILDNLNSSVRNFKTELSQATHLIITLGTSWVYRNVQSGEIVANCHKVPQKEFSKELLSSEIIKRSLQNILHEIQFVNPGINVILTVSPVRHIKDGFVENQWSKSNLIAAVHQMIKENPSVGYFPSYEIMMDELRDYRFYSEDMLHPNQTAIDYIWERFAQTMISDESGPVMKTVSSVQKGLSHKPFNPETQNHKDFQVRLEQIIDGLQKVFPHISF